VAPSLANGLPPTLMVSEPRGTVMTPLQTALAVSMPPVARVKAQVTSVSPTSFLDPSRRSFENVSWSPFETFTGPSAPTLVFGALSR
jgi:hypothetical protein